MMSSFTCLECERNAQCACVCSFPLPLLCSKHQQSHQTGAHFLLPPHASICIRSEEFQIELRQRLSKLQQVYAQILSQDRSEEQADLPLSSLLIQFEKDTCELKSRVKEIQAGTGQLEPCSQRMSTLSWLIWDSAEDEGELGTWLSLGRGLSLMAECKYQESCSVLEQQWNRRQPISGTEGLQLAVALGTVMGLHVGRFKEALAILEQSLQFAGQNQRSETAIPHISETMFQLTNAKAAILIHTLNFKECGELCMKAVQSFGETGHSEVSYGTALYFFMVSYTNCSYHRTQVEDLVMKWTAKTSSSRLVQHIRLCATALMAQKEKNYTDAERYIEEAAQLSIPFPAANFTALCSFLRDCISRKVLALKSETEPQYIEEAPCLQTHFPSSLVRAAILVKNAEYFRHLGKDMREIEIRQRAHLILQTCPQCDLWLSNVNSLGKALLRTKQVEAAFDLRYSTYRFLLSEHLDSEMLTKCFQKFQTLLEVHYMERLTQTYMEILRMLETTHPTHKHYSEVLSKLVEHYDWRGFPELALELCREKHFFLRKNFSNSSSYVKSVEILGRFYYFLEEIEKAIETYSEGFQIMRNQRNFRGYAQLISSFLNRNSNYSKEKQLEVLLDAHQFLVSNGSHECSALFPHLEKSFSSEPERLLGLMREVHRVLQETPAGNDYGESLCRLANFYRKRKQLEQVAELRLEAHRTLLGLPTCDNFMWNVEELANCYGEMNLQEAALRLQLEVHQLLLTDPTSRNFQRNLKRLVGSYSGVGRHESAVQLLIEFDHLLGSSQRSWVLEELSEVYRESGDIGAALQAKLELLKLQSNFTADYTYDVTSIADLYLELSRTESAVQLCVATLHTFQERHLYTRMRNMLKYLDRILENAGQVERAVELREKALRTLERDGVIRKYEEFRRGLVRLCDYSGNTRRAIGVYLESLRYLLLRASAALLTSRTLKAVELLYLRRRETCKVEVLHCRAVLIHTANLSITDTFISLRQLYQQLES